MDEPQIQNEKAGQEKTPPVEEPSAKSVIEMARELKEQIAKENDRREEILRREEELEARRMLGGRADAGQPKLTAEQERQARIQKEADEIANAFKK